jgi:hypothetical protein
MAFPVDRTHVKAAEAKLGVTFPLGFVSRMAKNNGGDVLIAGELFCLFPFFDTTDRTRIKRTCNDVVRETSLARQAPGFPGDAVAIGSNGTADRLILLPSVSQPARLQDAVCLWHHDTDEVMKVADDFTDLT